MEINAIHDFFKENVSKKKFKSISLDKENGFAVINSNKLCFDYDTISDKIKTSDTIIFNKTSIIFVEFKRGKISEIDFRLKSTESIVSFLNYSHQEGLIKDITFPNDRFQIYFVYDKRNASAPKLFTFREREKKLSLEYKHLFVKFKVIDNDNFKRIFGI